MDDEKLRTITGTDALARYITEHRRLGNLLTFVLTLAATIDDNRRIAMRALASINDDNDEKELELQLKKAKDNGAVSAFGNHFNLVKDMLVCRAVDNYLCYLTDLLSAIFRKRPETLKSTEQIRLDQVLAHDDGLRSFCRYTCMVIARRHYWLDNLDEAQGVKVWRCGYFIDRD